VSIAQAPIEPRTEEVGVVRCVQGAHLTGEVVERGAVVELAFKGGERQGQADRCLAANREGQLLG